MSIVRPFKAIRPKAEFADKVAALPYDVMSSDEARKMTEGNPYSFLHIDKAEIDLDENIDIYDDRVYKKASENLNKMISDGVFIQDDKPKFYIYMLTMNGKSQTGLVACTSIDEYLNDKIKKHELTREEKEKDRIRHVDECDANTGPIFLTYRAVDKITDIINRQKDSASPVYDFISDDDIRHTVWITDDESVCELIEEFKSVPALYIADGHHRNASAVKVGLKRRAENADFDENAEFNFYLSVLFPDKELFIMDYNRVVKDLNGLSEDEFFDKIRDSFDISECGEDNSPCKPMVPNTFGMYIGGKWFLLSAKSDILKSDDPVLSLDVSILQNFLLTPVLGIGDPRTDKRIDFVGGIRGLSELERRVDSGEMKVAFSMYPTTMEQLMEIADAGKIMPPKSTWFEPKLRSGLFIHKLK